MTPTFAQLYLDGPDAEKFLQGQLTCDATKLGLSYQPTAIGNLKGRIEFGLWMKRHGDETFELVTEASCMPALQTHIQKFSAFSKVTCQQPQPIYPCVLDDLATFSQQAQHDDATAWVQHSIKTGNYWITADTQGLFQPQALRLHQRGGIDYDKGCYLGQEVIARIYFKAAPKAFLHLVRGQGQPPEPGNKIQDMHVVNACASNQDDTFLALVVAKPKAIEASDLTLLELPEALQQPVGRSNTGKPNPALK